MTDISISLDDINKMAKSQSLSSLNENNQQNVYKIKAPQGLLVNQRNLFEDLERETPVRIV